MQRNYHYHEEYRREFNSEGIHFSRDTRENVIEEQSRNNRSAILIE